MVDFLSGSVNNQKNSVNTRAISLSAVFSALSVVLTMAKLTIPFPLLPYLEFDFSEIPITSVVFLIGPEYAMLSAAIYWIVLTIRAGDLLGPAMKFAAVASMIIGFWLVSKITNGKTQKSLQSAVTSGLVLGVVIRVLVMSVFNYVVLTVIAPFWLDYAAGFVAVLGLPTTSALQTILWVLVLTGIYNLLHTVLSVVPSAFISEAAIGRIPNLVSGSWIMQYKKK